jgi:hypothetical protein
MKNVVFWDVAPCGSCNNRRFGGTWPLQHQGDNNRRARNNVSSIIVFIRSVRGLLVTGNFVPSSPILVALVIEALISFETLVPTRATRRNTPEDGILRKNLFIYWTGAEPSQLLLRPFTGLLYQLLVTDGDDCGEIGGMDESQGNRAPVLPSPP